jgi:hypothetical protein
MSEPTDIPDFETLAADPEIAPLLDFAPVVRKIRRPDGWTDELQRELVARLASTGNLQRSVWQTGKHATGAEALYKTPSADSFRAAWDAAIALGRRRNGLDCRPPFQGEVPGITRRTNSRSRPVPDEGPQPGQVLNERGEWEDEESLYRRAEDARDGMTNKLLYARRLYLAEICGSPGKRAAFEILTELPIDWERAKRLKPQPDEPWRKPNMRRPDMLLTAENGWLGDMAHGPDKRAELQKAMDEYLEEMGLDPVQWENESNGSETGQFPSPSGEGSGVGASTKDASPPNGWAIVNPKGPGVRFL